MENKAEETVSEAKIEIEKEASKPVESVPKSEYSFKTSLGRAVGAGEITDIDYILDNNLKILEPEIVDHLLPDLSTDFLFIGQSKGKLGGGKRRIIRNTQKVTAKTKRQHFSAMAIVGDSNGHIGVGKGRSLESVSAKEKAVKRAKLSIIKISRGCGSWECACRGTHSIPFTISGKCGSVVVTLLPAPKGIGFCVADDIKTILKLAGIRDVWSRVVGQTSTRINLGYATFEALKQLSQYRLMPEENKTLGLSKEKEL
ncbi:30S ribosomal protein S5 [Candidatus Parvarchaeota archaeon]|nr:30S ribosomal protein S5 [Candidatus Parvarchaeota archaeon]